MSEKEAMSGNQGKDHRPISYAWGYLTKSLTYLLFFLGSAIVLYFHLFLSIGMAGPVKFVEEMLFYCGYVIVGSGIGLFFLAILKFNEANSLWNAARHGWLAPSLFALVLWIVGGIQNLFDGWPLATVAINILAMGLAALPGIIVFFAARLMERCHPVSAGSEKN